MECIQAVDFPSLRASHQRWTQSLIADGITNSCGITVVKTPAGAGSPAGLHTHVVDQIFYVLSGTMNVEINSAAYVASPGTLIVFQAGIPHCNWNDRTEATIHLAIIMPPSPDGLPLAVTVQS